MLSSCCDAFAIDHPQTRSPWSFPALWADFCGSIAMQTTFAVGKQGDYCDLYRSGLLHRD